MTTFITSDTHFGHGGRSGRDGVIKYCRRPFVDVEHMNESMVRRWNERVGKDDVVWHLGDFAFGPVRFMQEIRSRLNGRIILVRGNHDSRSTMRKVMGPDNVHEELYVKSEPYDYGLYLRHAPDFASDWPHSTVMQLCGHVHERYRIRMRADHRYIVNVGVDQWSFTPITFGEILDAIGVETMMGRGPIVGASSPDDVRGLPSHYREAP